jgi:hypothetical protein
MLYQTFVVLEVFESLILLRSWLLRDVVVEVGKLRELSELTHLLEILVVLLLAKLRLPEELVSSALLEDIRIDPIDHFRLRALNGVRGLRFIRLLRPVCTARLSSKLRCLHVIQELITLLVSPLVHLAFEVLHEIVHYIVLASKQAIVDAEARRAQDTAKLVGI